MLPEEDLIKQRREKRDWLISNNINPYAHRFDKKNDAQEILEKFKRLKKHTRTKTKVTLSGRIIALRPMGKITFGHLQDFTGKMQFYMQDTKKDYTIIKKLDIGDIIGISGIIFTTKTGEITIDIEKLQLLTKSLKPLPDKWSGLKDQEIRYRQRYVDLIVNPEVKEIFLKRAKVIQAIREYLIKQGYIEVETPILQPIYGGTSAKPFKSHLNALNMSVYMRISNEMYLKRLIAGGYEKIFEFSPDFRNEGIDKTHNPEFLQVETMNAYANYEDNMKIVEGMLSFVAKKVTGSYKVKYQNKILDFKPPWKKLTVLEAIKNYTKHDLNKSTLEEVRKVAKKLNVSINNEMKWGEIINLIFEEKVESQLIQPTLIYDYPADVSLLAKKKESDKRFAERFEPFINSWELGNVYSELNDPDELRKNWEEQEKLRKKGDEEAQPTDNDFIRCLEYGMPPVSGVGIGIDRLTMLLTNATSIREVIFFPFMKPEN